MLTSFNHIPNPQPRFEGGILAKLQKANDAAAKAAKAKAQEQAISRAEAQWNEKRTQLIGVLNQPLITSSTYGTLSGKDILETIYETTKPGPNNNGKVELSALGQLIQDPSLEKALERLGTLGLVSSDYETRVRKSTYLADAYYSVKVFSLSLMGQFAAKDLFPQEK